MYGYWNLNWKQEISSHISESFNPEPSNILKLL